MVDRCKELSAFYQIQPPFIRFSGDANGRRTRLHFHTLRMFESCCEFPSVRRRKRLLRPASTPGVAQGSEPVHAARTNGARKRLPASGLPSKERRSRGESKSGAMVATYAEGHMQTKLPPGEACREAGLGLIYPGHTRTEPLNDRTRVLHTVRAALPRGEVEPVMDPAHMDEIGAFTRPRKTDAHSTYHLFVAAYAISLRTELHPTAHRQWILR